jgi:eukaryotic-like serine/threonine-protein kinase
VEQRIGRYELIRPIAAGGMATVHVGRVVGAGGFQRVVAIKVMHAHIASDPDFVAMFLDEARLAAGIRHPNVVATLDIEQIPDSLFLVMEYVEGLAISALMKSIRKRGVMLPIPVALRIVLDTLSGLHAAHELLGADGRPVGLVHRDVSPQNVLVGVDGIARITDFGVARAEARISSTRGSQVKGKVPYMSPEQLHAEVVDRRSDVWAVGVVLWEMLTGRRLFHAPNDGALVAAVLRGASHHPHEVRPEVPAAIGDVCMQALSPLAQRFVSAAEFADELERAAEAAGVPIATPRGVGKVVDEEMTVLGAMRLPQTVAGAGVVPEDFKSSPFAARAPSDDGDEAATIAREAPAWPLPAPTPSVGSLPVGNSGASAIASVLTPRKRSAALGVGAGVVVFVLTALGATALWLVTHTKAPSPVASETVLASSGPSSQPEPATSTVEAPAPPPSAPEPVASESAEPAPDAAAPPSKPETKPGSRWRPPVSKPPPHGEFQPGRL